MNKITTPLSLLIGLALASQTTQAVPPRDLMYPEQWALNNQGQTTCATSPIIESDTAYHCDPTLPGVADVDLNAPEGWSILAPTQQEVVIALLDSGIDVDHPDLRDHLWVNPGESDGAGHCVIDGIDNDGNGYVDDCHGINTIVPRALPAEPCDSTPLSDPLPEGCVLNDEAGLHHRSWLVNDPGSQVAVACEMVPPGSDPIPEGCVANPYYVVNEAVGHGTAMAGHIAASIDNVESQFGGGVVGLAGAAANVKIMTCSNWELMEPLLFPGLVAMGGTPENAIECANYFANMKARGVNVVAVNISGGASAIANTPYYIYPGLKPELSLNTEAVRTALNLMREKDILVIASAGNFDWNIDNNESRAYYPASFDFDHIISVAAIDNAGNRWHNSAAQGSSFGRYSVDVAAPGARTLSTSPLEYDGYSVTDGTSQAAAYVSGLVGLIKAHGPTAMLTSAEVRRLILSSGKPLAALKDITVSGSVVRVAEIDGDGGALTCSDRLFQRRQAPTYDSLNMQPGETLHMEVQSYRCERVSGAPWLAVTDTVSGQEVFRLYDNGVAPDAHEGDGIFTGEWKVTAAQASFKLSYGLDTVTQAADVLTVSTPIILDNGASGNTRSAGWSLGYYGAPAYGGAYRYTTSSNPAWFKWNFNLVTAGHYKVYGWWPDRTVYTSNAQFVIEDSQGSHVVGKSQRTDGGKWVDLGTYEFSDGAHSVVLKNTLHTDDPNDIETLLNDGAVIADAIKIEKVSE